MKHKSLYSFIVLIFVVLIANAQPAPFNSKTQAIANIPRVEGSEIKTPYPQIFEIKQTVDSNVERNRLKQLHKKFDHAPTPYYAEKGTQVIVKLETIKKASDGKLPLLVIGTPIRHGDKRIEYKLSEGVNVITSTEKGVIYFRFVSEKSNPDGEVKIAFMPESGQKRLPQYVKGVTGHEEFKRMLDTYNTRDVLYSSDKAIVVVGKDAAIKYSKEENKEVWFAALERVLDIEDNLSGIDAKDPNPLHRPLAKGVRHLFVESHIERINAPMFSTDWATGYTTDSARVRLLSVHHMLKNNWGVAHELGHQHQCMAITPSNIVEATVNIYSLAVQRAFYTDYTRAEPRFWQRLNQYYFSMPIAERNYFDNGGNIRQAAYGIDFSRLLLFEQLYFIFGEELFRKIHRAVREENVQLTRSRTLDDEKKYYFVWKVCQLTGYDMREYFREWGYTQTMSQESKNKLDDSVTKAKLKQPPYSTIPYQTKLHQVTGQNLKEYKELPLSIK